MDNKLKDYYFRHATIKGEDECWEWNGTVSTKGDVPICQAMINGEQVRTSARKVVWEIWFGTVPELPIYMTCGNELCTNPNHMSNSLAITFEDKLRELFLRDVEKGRTEDDCWNWMGEINVDGSAGNISVQYNKKKYTIAAARVALMMDGGPLPPPHSYNGRICEVQNCVNPKHIVRVTSGS